MFTDEVSHMGFGFPIKTKGEAAVSPQTITQDKADPFRLCIGTAHCDKRGEFKRRL